MPPILDGLKDAGFHYATRAGVTVSVYDATIPPTKAGILAQADERVAAIDEDYEMGLMSTRSATSRSSTSGTTPTRKSARPWPRTSTSSTPST